MRSLCFATCLLAAPALAEDGYSCSLTAECSGQENCRTEMNLPFDLTGSDDKWQLTMPNGDVASFRPVDGAEPGDLRLISVNFDPDAAAVSLLSLTGDGDVFLSTHGGFPGPDVVTHFGTCTEKDN